jgi:putative nucleotidyltransferase with HDIG domain
MPNPSDKKPPRRQIEARAIEIDEKSAILLPGQLLQALRVLLVTSDNKLPMLPEIAHRLLEMSNRPNVDIDRMVAEITRDATVTGRLLAIANSAFYLRGAPATSLKAAVLRLGMRETRDVVFRIVSASTMLRVPEWADTARAIRRHSLVAAYVGREVGRALQGDVDLAFLGGLLHDVGRIFLLLTVIHSGTKPLPAMDDLADVLREDHAEAGALTAEYWKLPPALVSAIRMHHHPSPTDALATAVAVADRICHHLGIGVAALPITPANAPVFGGMHLTPDRIGPILEYARKVDAEVGEGE